MKQNKLLIFVVLLIIFVFGCERQVTDPGVSGSFIGGSKGLTFEFVDDEPPSIVQDNNQQEFFITLAVENEGEFDIPRGKAIATLAGINKIAFGLSSLTAKNDNEITGKIKARDTAVGGSEEEISFGLAKYKDDLSADFNTEMVVNLCYEYETSARVNLCLKRNPVNLRDDDVCEVDENKDVESSGAPVKISSLTETRQGSNEIGVRFDINKVGTGTVYEPGTFTTSCSENKPKKDRLQVELITESGSPRIVCSALGDSSKGIIRLVDEGSTKTVICKLSTSNLQEEAFESPLIIKLKYMYKDSTSKPITVEDSEF